MFTFVLSFSPFLDGRFALFLRSLILTESFAQSLLKMEIVGVLKYNLRVILYGQKVALPLLCDFWNLELPRQVLTIFLNMMTYLDNLR